MCKMDYSTYLDKVKGCFLGKAVIGTLGAPYEGVKMPMNLTFKPEMVNTMLPNDDLDLQVLWLDVVERYGINFTPEMLQKAFVENCDYSPGEYAIMRKNFEKGIYPPYSGAFCNDYYIEGMGCPIRSEIWACLAPGNPEMAAEFASRDGILDHKGESVYAERFFAAVESAAFMENDLYKLIEIGFSVIPTYCKFREMVENVMAYCEQYKDIKEVLSMILFKYGHPDCTNMFQNMGITMACLIKGEYDMLATGMMALNCGFDTDCTCASAGALLGIILGDQEIQKRYGWGDIRYVLGVRSHRRSDSIWDLSEDIAQLGVRLSADILHATEFTDAPNISYSFQTVSEIQIKVDYVQENPTIGYHQDCAVVLSICNTTGMPVLCTDCTFVLPENILLRDAISSSMMIGAGESVSLQATFVHALDADTVHEKNLIQYQMFCDTLNQSISYTFGISGNKLWKMTGPIWKTFPATNEQILGDTIGYYQLFSNCKNKKESCDKVRHFHLNFATDTTTDYFMENELFAPLSDTGFELSSGGTTLFARPYVEQLVQIREDTIELKDLMGFRGPCVVYMSQKLFSPEDRAVCVQLGYSAPYKLFINGTLIGSSDGFDQWTSENHHFENIQLKKGENHIVIRLTRGNRDDKFSLIFSKEMSCAAHYCDFSTGKF